MLHTTHREHTSSSVLRQPNRQQADSPTLLLRPLGLALLLMLMTVSAMAQQGNGTKNIVQEKDTVSLFRSVSVSADLVGIAQLAFSDYGQYEAAARVNLRDKYFPIVEVGLGKANSENVTTKMTYKTSAPYLRAGVDFNLMKNKHDDYRVFVGARYALTYFKYDAFTTGLKDPVWGDDADYRIDGEKCNYHWLEGVVSVDAKIWGPLRLGWSVRYRKRLFYSDGEAGNCWYVPGYGKQGGTRLGGTFNVTIEI